MATQNKSIEEIVDVLSNLTVLDLSKLKEALESKWNVKAAAAAVVAAPVAQQAEEVEEATDFKVTLESISADKKIAAIKVVREITGLGLKEAKELVEGTPKVLKESATKAETDEILKKVESAGAKASAKGL